MSTQDEKYMQMALKLARRGIGSVEPNPAVGAVIIKADKIIGKGRHKKFGGTHAEINAIEDCRKLGANPKGATMYVTLEPCPMCAGAMVHARVERLVYAASDPRTGAAGSVMDLLSHPDLNHQVKVSSGVLADVSAEMLQNFFQSRRKN